MSCPEALSPPEARPRRAARAALAAALVLALWAPRAGAVTIYRLGGEWLPPPPEVGRPGVDFRQLSWSSLGEVGATSRLRIGQGIGPVEHTAAAPLTLRIFNDAYLSLRPLYDRDDSLCGLCGSFDALHYLCGVRSAICRGAYGLQGTINIDLGDRVLLDEIHLHSGDALGRAILADFGLSFSAEPLGTDRTPRSPFPLEVRGNTEADLVLSGLPDHVRMAGIQLAIAEHSSPVTIREVEVYARGPASHAAYTSDIMDFGRPAVWGGLRWRLRGSGSTAHVTTRAGEGDDLFVYWKYTGIGDTRVEVTRTEYEELRSGLRAGITYNYDSWTVWSAEGGLADTTVTPPVPVTPHPAFQLNLTIDTEGDSASTLDFLEFRAAVPPVTLALGELDPTQVDPGGITDFTYSLKARVEPTDGGFDRIELAAIAAGFEGVTAVTIEGRQVAFTVESLAEDRLVLGLPRVGLDQADAILEVHFRARALRYGASFAGFLLDSERPYDLRQPVQPGDAVEEVFSDRVWIETTIRVESVLTASAQPRVITPNGDGTGDVARIRYDVFETTGPVPVSVHVYDLAGRRLRALHEGGAENGHYERVWDGRDDAGRLVPPGIYVFRAVAHLVDGDFSRQGVIDVAY